MIIKDFELFDNTPTDYNMIIVCDSDHLVFSNPHKVKLSQIYRIAEEADIYIELMDCFIYDGYYCLNMDSYYFGFGECSDELFNTLYNELIRFILKYNINPSHFKFIKLDGCNLTEEMVNKLSKINDISTIDVNYS